MKIFLKISNIYINSLFHTKYQGDNSDNCNGKDIFIYPLHYNTLFGGMYQPMTGSHILIQGFYQVVTWIKKSYFLHTKKIPTSSGD